MSVPRPKIFSAPARRAKLDRAATTFARADFLHQRAAEEIVDRLETVLKDFPRALFYGAGGPAVAARLTPAAGVGDITFAGESARFLRALDVDGAVEAAPDALPFEDQTFDLVVSAFALHAADDLPKALLEARRVLKPDGLFVALFPGERTLHELRGVLQAAEAGVTGRVAPRVAPMVAVRDGGALLQRTGFALPVSDIVSLPVRYGDPTRLFADLRAMGETSVLSSGPKGALRRDVLAALMTGYAQLADEDGVPATFDLVALTGWAPHESQPKPLKPGSATRSLRDAVKEH